MFPSISLLSNLVSAPFKRAQLGLFHGKTKQYGNSVPNSKHKTRRTWLPNIHNRRLFSDTLQHHLRVKLTARALKTIHKASPARGHGGIDNYLLKTKPELLGWEGMRLRVLVRERQ
ncbi:mitochondrial 50S ribosomal protein L28-like protein, partial [Dichomitus squalens]